MATVRYYAPSGDPWLTWADLATTTTDTSVWSNWTGTAATTASTYGIWNEWLDSTGSYYNQPIYNSVQPLAQPSQRQAEYQALAAAEQSRLALESARRRWRAKRALMRSEKLLLTYLSPEQRAAYSANKSFLVHAPSGTRYLLKGNMGCAGNIEILGANNRSTHRLCCHAAHGIPLGDQLITQMLLLQHDEPEFLRVANRTVLTPGNQV